MSKPKAILFDIGGVCVISPMKAILDYEIANGIPKDYVNFAISQAAPGGAWHQLERGELKMDESFFSRFQSDLHRQDLWEKYHKSFKNRRLADVAKSNATRLGDPISLKAETSDRVPTPREVGASTGGNSSSPIPDQADTGYSKSSSSFSSSDSIPPLPTMDTTALFWEMMHISRTPDPYMFPALRKLRDSKKFVVGALSNTVIFPPDHEYSKPNDVHNQFDVFVSSAHVGLRKPDPAIYKLAIEELNRADREKGGSGLTAGDVVFLDDIGSNLKAAREVGLRTIKVNLGRVQEAVAELESITGLQLADSKAKL